MAQTIIETDCDKMWHGTQFTKMVELGGFKTALMWREVVGLYKSQTQETADTLSPVVRDL